MIRCRSSEWDLYGRTPSPVETNQPKVKAAKRVHFDEDNLVENGGKAIHNSNKKFGIDVWPDDVAALEREVERLRKLSDRALSNHDIRAVSKGLNTLNALLLEGLGLPHDANVKSHFDTIGRRLYRIAQKMDGLEEERKAEKRKELK